MPIDVEEATRQADALLQGAVTQFSKPLVIPTSEPVDLTRAMETLNRAETAGGEHAQTVTEMDKLFAKATAQEKEALGKEGEAKASLAISTGERSQQEARTYTYYQRLFGMDMAPDSEIANAAHEQTKLRPTLNAKLDRINQLKSVSFFDNPIDYFLNSFELPAAVEDYNTTATKVNILQDTIDAGLHSARNAGDLANKGIPTITASMAAANANIALAEAAKKKADADEKLATVSVDFASKKLAAELSLNSATIKTTELEMQNERLKYETLINAVRLADSHGARLEGAAKLLYEVADRAHLQQVILDGYDRNVGNPKGTTNVLTFNRLPAAERENIVAIGAGSAGTNPYEFLKNFKHVGPLLSAETGRLLNFVQEEDAKVKRDPTVEPKVQEQRIAKYLKDRIEAEASRPSQSKIFSEMTPAKMIASGAVSQGSKLAEVLAPLANTEGSVTTNTVIETISKAYPNPTEAGAVIAQYYRANVDLRNKSLNMSLMGMKAPNSYNVPLKRKIFAYSYGEVYDLTKDSEATKYLISTKIQEQAFREQEAQSNELASPEYKALQERAKAKQPPPKSPAEPM